MYKRQALTADNDYTAATGTVTFAVDDVSETITIATTADTKYETNEAVNVNLSAPVNATILDNQGVGTITNDDTQPTISISDVSVAEGGNLVYTVTLSNASYQTITVDYATADGTALTADNDYTAATGTVTFAVDDVCLSLIHI